MPTGPLVKIFPNKKLLVKISEKTYDNFYKRLYNESKKKNYPTEYLAVFTKEDDDGEDVHFAKLTPDKYDKQNMPMFERLLRKDITFSTRMKAYDFMNDDNEQVCGINLEVTSIHQLKPATGMPVAIDEIDEIADKAAARACSKETKLNAEEQAIDEDVEKQVAKRCHPIIDYEAWIKMDEQEQKAEYEAWVRAQEADMIARCQKEMAKHGKVTLETRRDAQRLMDEHMSNHELHRLTCFWELPPAMDVPIAPPVLERQNAMTHRRRRCAPVADAESVADYHTPEEIRAFAVIDAFEQAELAASRLDADEE